MVSDKEYKKAYFVGKFSAVAFTFIVLLIAIPFGFINPSVGWLSPFNFYRLTGGLSFYPDTGGDLFFLVVLAMGVAIYFVLYKKY